MSCRSLCIERECRGLEVARIHPSLVQILGRKFLVNNNLLVQSHRCYTLGPVQAFAAVVPAMIAQSPEAEFQMNQIMALVDGS